MPLTFGPKLFDRYDLCARVAPGVMAALPIAIALAVHMPTSLPGSFSHLALYTAGMAGLAWVLGAWARGRGRRAQERLVAKWGGMPTELLLRHGDPRIEPATKARYHSVLQAMAPDLRMPTAEEEEADPAAALRTYRSAVRRLIESRREAVDNLVLADNVGYGFWRNLYGCRAPALGISIVAALAVISPGVSAMVRGGLQAAELPMFSVLLSIALLAWGGVIWVISAEWRVRDAALSYAERLLSTLDRPARPKSSRQRNTSVRAASNQQ